jgi:hypothetical protein
MKRSDITAVRELAAEHFEGNIEMAAAAHHFGLGVVKMKKGIPKHATRADREAVKAIVEAVRPGKMLGAGTTTPRRSAKVRSRRAKAAKAAAPAAAATVETKDK